MVTIRAISKKAAMLAAKNHKGLADYGYHASDKGIRWFVYIYL